MYQEGVVFLHEDKNIKKYNHYVPQFYLKNFSGNNSIGVFNFERKKFVNNAPIRRTAGMDYLYGETPEVENWLERLEGRWASIVKNIIKTQKLPKSGEDYTYLIMLVYLSGVRNLETADAFKDFMSKEAKALAHMLADSGKINLTEKDIDNLQFIIDKPNLIYFKNMSSLTRTMSDLCPLIIVNESKMGFITSDCPVVKYNKWFIDSGVKHPYGYGHMGFICFIPLSTKICFCLYDDVVYKNILSDKDRIRIYNTDVIEQLNLLFMHNSYREVYYEVGEKNWLESVVVTKKDKCETNYILGDAQYGFLQAMITPSVYEKIGIPFLKINYNFKNAKIPLNEQYLLRPLAYKEMIEGKNRADL